MDRFWKVYTVQSLHLFTQAKIEYNWRNKWKLFQDRDVVLYLYYNMVLKSQLNQEKLIFSAFLNRKF